MATFFYDLSQLYMSEFARTDFQPYCQKVTLATVKMSEKLQTKKIAFE